MENVSYDNKLNSGLKHKLDTFIQSDWFIIVFAIATALAWCLQVEYAYFLLVAILATYLFYSQQNLKPILAISVLMFMAYSGKNQWSYVYFVFYLVIGIFLVTAIIYRFYIIFLSKQKLKKGEFLFPMLMAGLAIVLGGLGYMEYDYSNHIRLIAVCLLLIFIYILGNNFTDKDLRGYVCKILLGSAIVCIVEISWFYVSQSSFNNVIQSNGFSLGWINSNNFATLMLFSAIMMVYMSCKNSKYSAFYLLMCGLCCFGIVFTFSETSVIFMLIAGFIAWFYGYKVAQKKKNYLTFSVSCLVVLFGFLITLCFAFPEIVSAYKRIQIFNFDKLEIYEMAVKKAKQNIIFGCGFYGDDAGLFPGPLWFIFNTPLNILFATGIVGVVLFLYYYIARFKIQTEYLSKFKIFALIAVVCLECVGLFELTFICVPIHILTILIVLACEKETERADKINIIQKRGI